MEDIEEIFEDTFVCLICENRFPLEEERDNQVCGHCEEQLHC